jgi:hypothetical protein
LFYRWLQLKPSLPNPFEKQNDTLVRVQKEALWLPWLGKNHTFEQNLLVFNYFIDLFTLKQCVLKLGASDKASF